MQTAVEAKQTTSPLVIPPANIATVTSIADNGGYKRSTILPCILEITKEEDVFAKAFCIICITINPGTKKIVNLCPRTSALPFPTAKLKTAKKRKKVTTGDKIVCIQTLKNLNTSFI